MDRLKRVVYMTKSDGMSPRSLTTVRGSPFSCRDDEGCLTSRPIRSNERLGLLQRKVKDLFGDTELLGRSESRCRMADGGRSILSTRVIASIGEHAIRLKIRE